MSNTVVAYALPDDEHVGRVSSILSESGVEVLSISPVSDQEIDAPLGSWATDRECLWRLPRLNGSGILEIKPSDAVFWFRNKFSVDNVEDHDDQRRFFESSTRLSFFQGCAAYLGFRTFNHAGMNLRPNAKVYQLSVARRYGFDVPDTLISSDKAQIAQFTRDRDCIIKPYGIAHVPAPAGSKEPPFIFMTTVLKHEEVVEASDGAFSAAPVIVQALVEKDYELRVVAFGGDILSYKIDSQSQELSKIDWRWGEQFGLTSAHSLPREVEDSIRRFLIGENLDSGVFDFAVTKDGRHMFFECNPSGQWAMLEDEVQQEISQMFARNFARILKSV